MYLYKYPKCKLEMNFILSTPQTKAGLNFHHTSLTKTLNHIQMEYPPSCWLIREAGLFETAVARPVGNLSVEVLAKVPIKEVDTFDK